MHIHKCSMKACYPSTWCRDQDMKFDTEIDDRARLRDHKILATFTFRLRCKGHKRWSNVYVKSNVIEYSLRLSYQYICNDEMHI